MSVLMLTLPIALVLGGLFLGAFIWAVLKGQFDDLVGPAYRILNEPKTKTSQEEESDAGKTGRI